MYNDHLVLEITEDNRGYKEQGTLIRRERKMGIPYMEIYLDLKCA